jgi:hypothetical protein
VTSPEQAGEERAGEKGMDGGRDGKTEAEIHWGLDNNDFFFFFFFLQSSPLSLSTQQSYAVDSTIATHLPNEKTKTQRL